MGKRKGIIEDPWMWAKAKARSDIENYLILEGLLLILIYFALITIVQGPYFENTVVFSENDMVHIRIPIWIVFVFMGCISILLGFLLKIPMLRKGIDTKLRLFSLVGMELAAVNMVGLTLLFHLEYGGGYDDNLYELEPIILLATICASALFLIFDLIVIKRGYRKHLPL